MNHADIAGAIAKRKSNPVRRFMHWLYMALWFNGRRRFVRGLLRVGLLPASTKADTDTMGEYKRLMAEKDDPKPGLVLPDPNAPHAELIRRVRLYAQNGAKALAPLLDNPLPDPEYIDEDGVQTDTAEEMRLSLRECRDLARTEMDDAGLAIVFALASDPTFEVPYERTIRAVHAAYNSPWTVIDGEVYEYESERKRRVVQ
jgi:hypothetical protein